MSNDNNLRNLFKYQLRAHVAYQDGRDSLAPALVFADADYEVGDGTCGLHADGKSANEPAIIYARVDSLVDALGHIEALEAELEGARSEARSAIADAYRMGQKARRVKSLEWKDIRETEDPGVFAQDAWTEIGRYIAASDGKHGSFFRVRHGGFHILRGSIQDAKAAAQTDYERRILDAMEEDK